MIYDPTTGQPFQGNVIPGGRIDSVARNILTQLYPEPNNAGTTGAGGQNINNYLINPIKERQDNQFDLKFDHNLTSSNRFFIRYSFQKTHRLQPATLPHGDAGATFGAGDGNIKGQSLAFNDTQMLSSSWLNEFRFGWSSIKFLMTPIDFGTNPAQAVGLPGINLNSVTSAMTQLGFQNIRNLGANSNQPLITNQNDFQIFDSLTRSTGRHTMKFGGSLTLRSREILNADTIVGNFSFNNNMTSNCAGQPAGCTVNSATGFDVASFMLGLVSAKNRNLFDAGTYTEKRPEIAMYVAGRLPRQLEAHRQHGPALRHLSALARDRGSAVELRRHHRQVRRRLRRRGDRRREGGALPADLLESEPRSALRVRLRPRRQRHGTWSAAASACSGTSRPAAPRPPRRRIRRSSSPRR